MEYKFKAVVEGYKLPTNAPLLPLFEAIINSIQSIEAVCNRKGEITISVLREQQKLGNVFFGGSWETDVCSFTITDNGIGFNDDNYHSFDTFGSEYKSDIGCKGVGRALWLKAFSKVQIESTYLGTDGNYYDRNFDFSITDETKIRLEQRSVKTQPFTKVVLTDYFHKYKTKCPKRIETLARDIMNHCFAYLALDICPRITICDEQDLICINDLFKESIGQLNTTEFTVEGYPFSLISAKNYAASNDKHILHFCAHKREVFGDNLSSYITELTGKLSNDDKEFTYVGYISSHLLDENINIERTDFAFANTETSDERDIIDSDSEIQLEMTGLGSTKTITKKNIIDNVVPIIRGFLKNEIEAYNLRKRERVVSYVNNTNPRYRSMIRHYSECIDKIPLTYDDEKLDLELFKQEQAYQLTIRKDQNNFVRNDLDSIVDFEDYTARCSEFLKRVSDLGKDELAGYIMHRKVMLDILDRNLQYKDETKKKYALEKEIHNIIFPMITTSDDIDYSKHNLWMIDERLAYHYYLASDKPLSSYTVVESDCDREPDIVIFGPAFALTGDSQDSEIGNITIIEFKRPGRTDKGCIDQVVEYVKEIKTGRLKDKNGTAIAEMSSQSLRFSCYILCDIAPDMADFLAERDYKKTPDGKSYYRYHDTYNAYIEVLPYSKMVRDSIKRNKILFDKLLANSGGDEHSFP
ncbi:MAG: ATP-binding protein [Oscillospiraceae bacterium]|nr:ATP-binding protein [Oscillospiraceae bacterium]